MSIVSRQFVTSIAFIQISPLIIAVFSKSVNQSFTRLKFGVWAFD